MPIMYGRLRGETGAGISAVPMHTLRRMFTFGFSVVFCQRLLIGYVVDAVCLFGFSIQLTRLTHRVSQLIRRAYAYMISGHATLLHRHNIVKTIKLIRSVKITNLVSFLFFSLFKLCFLVFPLSVREQHFLS